MGAARLSCVRGAVQAVVANLAERIATLEVEAAELEDALARGGHMSLPEDWQSADVPEEEPSHVSGRASSGLEAYLSGA
jgi:hypothetical protein